MERKKRPAHPIGENGRELFDNDFSVASASECTGLIPGAPISGSEVDAYSELYDIPLAQSSRRKKK